MPVESAGKTAASEAKRTRNGKSHGHPVTNGSGAPSEESLLESISVSSSAMLKDVEEKVARNPLDGIAVAFMAGVVFSLLMSRR